MTELSFLIDLLLNHKLPKATKDAVAVRIKEVECSSGQFALSRSQAQGYQSSLQSQASHSQSLPLHVAQQAPSTQRIMAKHQDLVASHQVDPPRPDEQAHIQQDAPQPVAVIAKTPAAVAAVNAREQSIRQAMSGKPMPGETKPRKF